MSRTELKRFLRFLVAGAANTALTGTLLLVIAAWVQIDIAYTIVYVIGLVFTTLVTARFVFRLRLTARTALRFVAWYVCVYLVGISVVHLATQSLHGSHLLATIAVLLATAPLNFLGGKRALGVTSPRASI
jgi:putative flippase GtrA